jgi:hypothetical protein
MKGRIPFAVLLRAQVAWVVLFLLFINATTFALVRPYDPVVVMGEQLTEFLGTPVNELCVYVLKNGQWQQIPFQVDERDGGEYFGAKNGTLDQTDEICFLVADMGDSAQDFQWIGDNESIANDRYQIATTDTSETTQQKVYAYIYSSSTLSLNPNLESYMAYIPPPTNAFNDTIKGQSYTFAHSAVGIPDHLALSTSVGGSGQDIMDRWKIRLEGKAFGFLTYTVSEEELQVTSVLAKVGRVRIIRKALYNLSGLLSESLSLTTFFYPNFSQINTGSQNLTSEYGVELLRQSTDYNANMVGGLFHNTNNPNVPIDGLADRMNTELTVPGTNWFMVQHSTHGTVATVVEVPQIGQTQSLYFIDNSTADPNDTGDKLSYGDSGVLVTSTSAIVGTFGLQTATYFLGPNHNPAIGDTLAKYFDEPLQVNVMARYFVVPVELASFSARYVHEPVEGVLLEWMTETETNNLGFTVERKTEPTGEWGELGFLPGAGTSFEPKKYSYLDRESNAGEYTYRLKQSDTDGSFVYSKQVTIAVNLPGSFALWQNYPNPFNPSTTIPLYIPADYNGTVTVRIFNTLGQQVRLLHDDILEKGRHEIEWDGLDDAGRAVVSGVYIYSIEAGGMSAQRRMIKLD